jgi:hypothetical protein
MLGKRRFGCIIRKERLFPKPHHSQPLKKAKICKEELKNARFRTAELGWGAVEARDKGMRRGGY